MPTIPRILTTTALCLAAVGVSSCSWCWPSLHTSEAVLHQDKQVVVSINTRPSFKYRYQGNDYYPITLAYAVDKGKSIYRRGDCRIWCRQDTSARYEVKKESIRSYLYSAGSGAARGERRLIPEKEFNFVAAKRIPLSAKACVVIGMKHIRYYPYAEYTDPVADMPDTTKAAPASVWQHIAAAPLELVDATANIAMPTAEATVLIAILPVAAVGSGISKLFNEITH